MNIEAAINFIDGFIGRGLQPFMNKKIHASPNKIQNESCKQLKFPNGDRPRRRPPQNSRQITFQKKCELKSPKDLYRRDKAKLQDHH